MSPQDDGQCQEGDSAIHQASHYQHRTGRANGLHSECADTKKAEVQQHVRRLPKDHGKPKKDPKEHRRSRNQLPDRPAKAADQPGKRKSSSSKQADARGTVAAAHGKATARSQLNKHGLPSHGKALLSHPQPGKTPPASPGQLNGANVRKAPEQPAHGHNHGTNPPLRSKDIAYMIEFIKKSSSLEGGSISAAGEGAGAGTSAATTTAAEAIGNALAGPTASDFNENADTIYVSNIPYNVNQQQVQEWFSAHGTVVSVKMGKLTKLALPLLTLEKQCHGKSVYVSFAWLIPLRMSNCTRLE